MTSIIYGYIAETTPEDAAINKALSHEAWLAGMTSYAHATAAWANMPMIGAPRTEGGTPTKVVTIVKACAEVLHTEYHGGLCIEKPSVY